MFAMSRFFFQLSLTDLRSQQPLAICDPGTDVMPAPID